MRYPMASHSFPITSTALDSRVWLCGNFKGNLVMLYRCATESLPLEKPNDLFAAGVEGIQTG